MFLSFSIVHAKTARKALVARVLLIVVLWLGAGVVTAIIFGRG
jgi:hypothetical protein